MAYLFSSISPIKQPTPPTVSVKDVTSTSATIYWYLVEDAVRYNVYFNYKLLGTTESDSYKLDGLRPSTYYNVQVTAVNSDNQESEESDILIFETLNVPLEPPARTTVTNITSNSCLITWDAVMDAVQYCISVENIKLAQIMEFKVSETSYTLTELNPNTEYEIRISSIDENGQVGQPSDSLIFTTLQEQAKVKINVSGQTKDGIVFVNVSGEKKKATRLFLNVVGEAKEAV